MGWISARLKKQRKRTEKLKSKRVLNIHMNTTSLALSYSAIVLNLALDVIASPPNPTMKRNLGSYLLSTPHSVVTAFLNTSQPIPCLRSTPVAIRLVSFGSSVDKEHNASQHRHDVSAIEDEPT